jgi:hypothetical protein
MNGNSTGMSYLFEFRPPVGKGRDRQSVRLRRFETEHDARQFAAELLTKYAVESIRIFRVGANGESIPVDELPEPGEAASGESAAPSPL